MKKKENQKTEPVPIEETVPVEEIKEGLFTRWFKEKTKGKEKKTIYIMFTLMVLFTIFILVERFAKKQEATKFDLNKLYKPPKIGETPNIREMYNSYTTNKKLLEQYEYLISQDTLDTLKIKQIEKKLNDNLLNAQQ